MIRQTSPTEFQLVESFRYVDPAGTEVVVPEGDARDLASVPLLLTWLVPRYGRHTLPALLHDHLVVPGMDPDVRAAADATFRDTMGDAKVPFVRRWVMWAAVATATEAKKAGPSKVSALGWATAHAVDGCWLWRSLLWPGRQRRGRLVAGTLAASLGASQLWGRRRTYAATVALSVLVMPIAVVPILLVAGLYLAAEEFAKVYLRFRRAWRGDAQVNPIRPTGI